MLPRTRNASERAELARAAGGVTTFEWDLRSDTWAWTPELAALFGLDPGAPTDAFEGWRQPIFFDDVPKLRAAAAAAATVPPFYAEFRLKLPDGRVRWLAAKGAAAADERGHSRWICGALFDISERKELQVRLLSLNETLEARLVELRDQAHTLEILNRTGATLAAERNLQKLVQAITDAAVLLSGAQFGAFFYNLLDHKGESYTLYTLSGASREAFEKFPMPRNTAVFDPTFKGTGIVRSDNIREDPRYGKSAPYYGQPHGHLPVVSYLAVPVIARTGEVHGGLFLGHGEPGQFTARHEQLIAGLAGQAAVALDNARLLETNQRELAARRAAEAGLQQLNTELETRATERAKQLAAMTVRAEDTERRFRLLVDAVSDYAIFMLDPEGRVVNWNPGAQRIKGYALSEIVGQHFSRFYTPEDVANGVPDRNLKRALTTGRTEDEGWRVRKDGSRFWASVVISAIRDESGDLLGFAKVTRDLSERRAAEERMRQAQKMEAIGQLTGGVAHDFNNLLAVISGNLEALQRRVTNPADAELRRYIAGGLRGTERAAGLTHRLLAFARRQPLDPAPLSVNTIITGMSEMFRRTLGESIFVETVLAAGLWGVFVDPNELEASLLNLAVNARDAMPDGGKLTIEAANVHLDEQYAAEADVKPGQYVGLFVSDTGTGMSPETVAKAFDPFFTTKDIGRGTGLGLSQVYGFIKQSGGHVKIYSEVGLGTTVKLYLPRHVSPEDTKQAPGQAPAVPHGRGETVLVVDDEPDVRHMAAEMLRELGYRAIEAMDGATALRLLAANREISILFTDVGLPGGMNGRQLADEARRQRAGLRVLFTSGYPRNAIVHHGRLDPGVALLMKPFTYQELAAKLRSVVERSPT
ncbi:MAG: PAS domain S-box protein [Alphaproteobacteria bacterium]|nr:PAS domain S-box protein [Alphaproteobacteria bacterium]